MVGLHEAWILPQGREGQGPLDGPIAASPRSGAAAVLRHRQLVDLQPQALTGVGRGTMRQSRLPRDPHPAAPLVREDHRTTASSRSTRIGSSGYLTACLAHRDLPAQAARPALRASPPILHRPCDSFPVSSTPTTVKSDASSRSSTRRTASKPRSRPSPTRRSASGSPRSARRSARSPSRTSRPRTSSTTRTSSAAARSPRTAASGRTPGSRRPSTRSCPTSSR